MFLPDEMAVCGRWPLVAVASQDRFYCIILHSCYKTTDFSIVYTNLSYPIITIGSGEKSQKEVTQLWDWAAYVQGARCQTPRFSNFASLTGRLGQHRFIYPVIIEGFCYNAIKGNIELKLNGDFIKSETDVYQKTDVHRKTRLIGGVTSHVTISELYMGPQGGFGPTPN